MTSETTTDLDTSYRDPALPVADRVERLLAQMTVPEKAGLFFQCMISIGPDGELGDGNPAFSIPSPDELVAGRHLNHFNLLGPLADPAVAARWQNKLQELAASTRLGIPVTLSTDPRHSFTDNPGAAFNAAAFSEWPETMGLAAIGDEDLVERFADIARQEYVAVGLRCALHPQVDLATEPRWARGFATFGEDADLTSRLGAAYIRGFQRGDQDGAFGPGSVSTMTKHFPGGGPQQDGEDPHFAYGREQIYPGGQFELHLKPFEAALAVGARQMMPYYGMPVGTEFEEVGFGFNKGVITGLLRERYGFDGIVCTDWGLITGHMIIDAFHPARAWGVEHLSERERMIKCLEAGVDQFGGEYGADLLVDIITAGEVSEDRIDVSVRRLLREKFELGLFDDPYVDPDRAAATVGNADFRAAGEAAQRASLTLITNSAGADGTPTLPLRPGLALYVEGIDPDVAAAYGTVVGSPAEADVAVLRLKAPYETRATAFENFFHAGSLEFPADVVAHVTEVAAQVPTVLDVFCDRPAILTPFVDAAAAIVLDFGASGAALLDVLSGRARPQGRLPFDLPSSMAAVVASRPDVPFDTADPLFRFGHGLSYPES
ncbi:glycoside hydrolase family 3 protein [Microlunatus ginsengisoli]|uniref:beta-glucosidase n=1 Tax=Microlunatus ginsengisoli TaxID=363863 RepID=A0ABP6ZUH7_9ACTN